MDKQDIVDILNTLLSRDYFFLREINVVEELSRKIKKLTGIEPMLDKEKRVVYDSNLGEATIRNVIVIKNKAEIRELLLDSLKRIVEKEINFQDEKEILFCNLLAWSDRLNPEKILPDQLIYELSKFKEKLDLPLYTVDLSELFRKILKEKNLLMGLETIKEKAHSLLNKEREQAKEKIKKRVDEDEEVKKLIKEYQKLSEQLREIKKKLNRQYYFLNKRIKENLREAVLSFLAYYRDSIILNRDIRLKEKIRILKQKFNELFEEAGIYIDGIRFDFMNEGIVIDLVVNDDHEELSFDIYEVMAFSTKTYESLLEQVKEIEKLRKEKKITLQRLHELKQEINRRLNNEEWSLILDIL
jgi:hypothetical protein